jgi:hypothetical protein
MHQIEGQYTLEDYRRAIALNARKGSFARLISTAVSVLFGLLLLGATVLVILGRIAPEFFLPMVVFFAVYLGMTYLYIPYQVKRVFHQQRELQKPFSMTFDVAGAVFRNEYGEAKIPWRDLVKWCEDEHLILLYHSDILFRMLPKRMITDPAVQEYIRSRLAEHNIPPAAKVRNLLREGVFILLFLVIIVVAVTSFLRTQ